MLTLKTVVRSQRQVNAGICLLGGCDLIITKTSISYIRFRIKVFNVIKEGKINRFNQSLTWRTTPTLQSVHFKFAFFPMLTLWVYMGKMCKLKVTELNR